MFKLNDIIQITIKRKFICTYNLLLIEYYNNDNGKFIFQKENNQLIFVKTLDRKCDWCFIKNDIITYDSLPNELFEV